jgi:hypothetical protein
LVRAATGATREVIDVAVRTEWDVTHACGHDQTRYARAKRSSERAGYAWWAGKREGSTCWTTQKDRETAKARGARIVEWPAVGHGTVGVRETRTPIGGLDGSDNAVEWARQVRHRLLTAAYDTLGIDDDAFADRMEGTTRTIRRSSGSIDHRAAEPAAIEELVADGALDEPARTEDGSH